MKIVDLVEHKGIGHPDTLADDLAEMLSKRLEKEYHLQYKKVQHYNVDKVLITTWNNQLYIAFAGQCTELDNIDTILPEVVSEVIYKAKLIYRLDEIKIINFLNEGSVDLINNFELKRCNDTSFSVGLYKHTKLEQLVLDIKEYINSNWLETGSDFKVFGAEFDSGLTRITIAKAFIARTRDEYDNLKMSFIKDIETKFKSKKVTIIVNNADNENTCFMTKRGSSVEAGDSGMTGRGNRLNGLITPFRYMTLEAYSGKNNQTHIGKIYQKLAIDLAKKKKKDIVIYNDIGGDLNEPFTN